jgi:hypothetical protein
MIREKIIMFFARLYYRKKNREWARKEALYDRREQ